MSVLLSKTVVLNEAITTNRELMSYTRLQCISSFDSYGYTHALCLSLIKGLFVTAHEITINVHSGYVAKKSPAAKQLQCIDIKYIALHASCAFLPKFHNKMFL